MHVRIDNDCRLLPFDCHISAQIVHFAVDLDVGDQVFFLQMYKTKGD